MRRPMLRRSAALLALAASLGVSACGTEYNKGDQRKLAESEASYLDLNGLKYQVQVSRQLNPRDVEDADYFRDLPPAESSLPRGTIWFGVFVRVENESKVAIPSARTFLVGDTRGNEFEPVESENVFAYRPETVPVGGLIPNPERLQAYAGSQGSLLLFKLPLASLSNRPLELTVKSPNDSRRVARVDLDV